MLCNDIGNLPNVIIEQNLSENNCYAMVLATQQNAFRKNNRRKHLLCNDIGNLPTVQKIMLCNGIGNQPNVSIGKQPKETFAMNRYCHPSRCKYRKELLNKFLLCNGIGNPPNVSIEKTPKETICSLTILAIFQM